MHAQNVKERESKAQGGASARRSAAPEAARLAALGGIGALNHVGASAIQGTAGNAAMAGLAVQRMPPKKKAEPKEQQAEPLLQPGSQEEASAMLASLDQKLATRRKAIKEGLAEGASMPTIAVGRMKVTGPDGTKYDWDSETVISGKNDPARPGNLEDGAAYRSAQAYADKPGNVATQKNDAEVKLLHEAYAKMSGWGFAAEDPSVTGVMSVMSSVATCASCRQVIADFRRAYPNVRTYTSFTGSASRGKTQQDRTKGGNSGQIQYGFGAEAMNDLELPGTGTSVAWKHDKYERALEADGTVESAIPVLKAKYSKEAQLRLLMQLAGKATSGDDLVNKIKNHPTLGGKLGKQLTQALRDWFAGNCPALV